MIIKLSRLENHLLFIDAKFDSDGIEEASMMGALAIKEGSNKKKVLAAAIKKIDTFSFGEESNGFYKIVRA